MAEHQSAESRIDSLLGFQKFLETRGKNSNTANWKKFNQFYKILVQVETFKDFVSFTTNEFHFPFHCADFYMSFYVSLINFCTISNII